MIVRICGFVSEYAGHETGQTPETHRVILMAALARKMLRDVNRIPARSGELCVSPINAQSDSNLKNPKFISLGESGFADMYPSLASRLVRQRGMFEMVPVLRVKSIGCEMSHV
jgi:hypothetical protein